MDNLKDIDFSSLPPETSFTMLQAQEEGESNAKRPIEEMTLEELEKLADNIIEMMTWSTGRFTQKSVGPGIKSEVDWLSFRQIREGRDDLSGKPNGTCYKFTLKDEQPFYNAISLKLEMCEKDNRGVYKTVAIEGAAITELSKNAKGQTPYLFILENKLHGIYISDKQLNLLKEFPSRFDYPGRSYQITVNSIWG